jgi:hypothetical protein
MSFEVEEDLEAEIEQFVALKRRCEYEAAHEAFNNTLLRHISFFPVIAEYADLLLEETKYRMLLEFVNIQLECLGDMLREEEAELLRIMRALARIHTYGALGPAREQAALTFKFLSSRSTASSSTFPTDVEV